MSCTITISLFIQQVEGAIAQLYRALTWCHQRQMFVQIQTGSYVPRTTLDSLSGWASQLTKIYNVKVCGAVERHVSLDWGMLELVFYDAYTNAQKYGHQEKEPWVELEIREYDSVLAVRVCNVADPAAPEITEDEFCKVGRAPAMHLQVVLRAHRSAQVMALGCRTP
jgi:hypothetical protein